MNEACLRASLSLWMDERPLLEGTKELTRESGATVSKKKIRGTRSLKLRKFVT